MPTKADPNRPKFVSRVMDFCTPLFPNTEKAMTSGLQDYEDLSQGERDYISAMMQAQTVVGIGQVLKELRRQNALLSKLVENTEAPEDEEDEGEEDEDDDYGDEDDPPVAAKPAAKPAPVTAVPPPTPKPAVKRPRPAAPKALPAPTQAVMPDEVIVPNAG